MEYRKCNYTPRDRLDENFIRELLELEGYTADGDDRHFSEKVTSYTRDTAETGSSRNNCNCRREERDRSCVRRQENTCRDERRSNGNTRSCTNRTNGDRSGTCCERRRETRDSSCGNRETDACRGESRSADVRTGSSDRARREHTGCGNNGKDETDRHSHCGCGDCDSFSAPTLRGVPLSMLYSPYQEWENVHDADEGHSRGTIFRCLEFPFYPVRCGTKCSPCKNNTDKCR